MEQRKPDFVKDNEIYGKFGEEDFKDFCKQIGYSYIDVSNELIYQLIDVDFLISKKDIPKDINVDKLLFSRNSTGYQGIIKFEVKTDTRSFLTRNVVYEVISHDFSGCMAETKADFVYYVFVDDTNGEIIKKESWSINITKWREYLRKYAFDNKISCYDMEHKYGIRKNNFDKHGDKVANLLCNIEKLEEYNIAKQIFKE